MDEEDDLANKMDAILHSIFEDQNDQNDYIVSFLDLVRLRTINHRLYDDRPLTGDDRRNLANKMDAILHSIFNAKIKTDPA